MLLGASRTHQQQVDLKEALHACTGLELSAASIPAFSANSTLPAWLLQQLQVQAEKQKQEAAVDTQQPGDQGQGQEAVPVQPEAWLTSAAPQDVQAELQEAQQVGAMLQAQLAELQGLERQMLHVGAAERLQNQQLALRVGAPLIHHAPSCQCAHMCSYVARLLTTL